MYKIGCPNILKTTYATETHFAQCGLLLRLIVIHTCCRWIDFHISSPLGLVYGLT